MSTARCLSLRSSRSFGDQCAPDLRALARTPHVGRSCVAHHLCRRPLSAGAGAGKRAGDAGLCTHRARSTPRRWRKHGRRRGPPSRRRPRSWPWAFPTPRTASGAPSAMHRISASAAVRVTAWCVRSIRTPASRSHSHASRRQSVLSSQAHSRLRMRSNRQPSNALCGGGGANTRWAIRSARSRCVSAESQSPRAGHTRPGPQTRQAFMLRAAAWLCSICTSRSCEATCCATCCEATRSLD